MSEARNWALITTIVDSLYSSNSWCGETHIQKTSYLLKTICGVPLDFDFVMYKYGPYSFDFSEELAKMQASDLLRIVPQPYPYGPSLRLGEASHALSTMYPKTIKKYKPIVDALTAKIGCKPAVELERLATVTFVINEMGRPKGGDQVVDRFQHYKPNIPRDKILESIDEGCILWEEMGRIHANEKRMGG